MCGLYIKMKTLKEIYFEQDLIANHPGGCDKETNHTYITDFYEEALKPFRNIPVNILEVGVAHGGSVNLWSKYFTNCTINGIDCLLDRYTTRERFKGVDNINLYAQDGTDGAFINKTFADNSMDIIIDDGSHMIGHQQLSLKLLWPKLKQGGLYVIEDIADIKSCDQLNSVPGGIISDLRHKNNRSDNIIMFWNKKG